MNRKAAERILRDVLHLPTAPFAEHAVVDHIHDFIAQRPAVKAKVDKVGNILVHYKKGPKRVPRPVCFAAHLDHPGFRAVKMTNSKSLKAEWHGGVAAEYFNRNRIKFHSGGNWIHGRINAVKTAGRNGRQVVESVSVDVTEPVNSGCPGMWDFPDPVIKKGQIHARACDDLAGASAMLACIDDLVRRKADGEAYFLFTRAEEVGFIGAIAACRLRTIPKKCVVVAIETSAERSNARIGDGPILRVGDKSTTFNSNATAFCAAVANDLNKKDKSFEYQRKLMDGGTCESSAYCQLGYDATGICIALGNYHNVNARAKKLSPEFVSLDDYDKLVRWFIALVQTHRRYDGSNPAFDATLVKLQKKYNKLLDKTK